VNLRQSADIQDEPDYLDVTAPDGVRLRVRHGGRRGAPAIVFIHGFNQSHRSWDKQFEGPLADEFHLVAYDLRGHGESDKPDDDAAYREPKRWADDLATILRTLDLSRVVLVGWSYGGRVIIDYLATYGPHALAGINFVAGVVGDEGSYYGEDIGLIKGTYSSNAAEAAEATRKFLRACFADEPPAAEFESMLAYNMLVTPGVRKKLGGRKVGAQDLLAGLDLPVLFTHGTLDRIIAPAMSEYGAATVPNARLSIYDGTGHSPFYEKHLLFDGELRDFVHAVHAVPEPPDED
jgi:non-heme chloroperoxidase